MRKLTENELWQRVRQLQGKTVYTIEQNRPNVIEEVTAEKVIIKGRQSPIRKIEAWDAYEELWVRGKLQIGKGGGKRRRFIYYVTAAILRDAVPEQVEVIRRGKTERFSGIQLKWRSD
jgi:hypothetical protein